MAEERITNRDFALHDRLFKRACEKASIPPTKRQASKFRRGKGRAFKSKLDKISQGLWKSLANDKDGRK